MAVERTKFLEILSGQLSITTQETPAEADRGRAVGERSEGSFLPEKRAGARETEAEPHHGGLRRQPHLLGLNVLSGHAHLNPVVSNPNPRIFWKPPQVGSVMLYVEREPWVPKPPPGLLIL